LNSVKSRTLEGRRIVVTRAAAQSGELRKRLEELGAEVVLLPLVRFLEPEDTADLDRAIHALEKFDWLIFTSTNAVTLFLRRCRALRTWPGSRAVKIAVVGSATRLVLEEEGLTASLVPREFNGAALAAELGAAVAGRNVLLPRSDRAGEELPSLLRKAGANVTQVVAYRTAGPDSRDLVALGALRDGQADAVTFFSPSAFHEFQKLVGPGELAKWNSCMALAAVGPVTAAAIRSAGLPVAVEANEASAASLVAALERHFSASKTKRSAAGRGPEPCRGREV
jgi:uroporphyrinogen III methyltransferase / synthase